jgi:hypothetical protein
LQRENCNGRSDKSTVPETDGAAGVPAVAATTGHGHTGLIAEQSKIDAVADELYSLPPAEFVAARDARAAEVGDKALAKQIKALRRPTTAAWAVNQLTRKAGPELTEALKLGEQLREAQQRLRGNQLRQLGQRRRDLVEALTKRASELSGHLGDEAEQQVRNTLTAALADPALSEQVRAGRLTKPLEHSGFGPMSAFTPEPDEESEQESGAEDAEDDLAGDDLAERRRRRRERQLAEAKHALSEAGAAVREAREDARTAAAVQRERERQVDELREQLRRAEREEQQAAHELDKSEESLKVAERAREAAQLRVDHVTLE